MCIYHLEPGGDRRGDAESQPIQILAVKGTSDNPDDYDTNTLVLEREKCHLIDLACYLTFLDVINTIWGSFLIVPTL